MRPALRSQPAQEAPPPDEGLLTHAVHLQATTPVDATLPVSRGVPRRSTRAGYYKRAQMRVHIF